LLEAKRRESEIAVRRQTISAIWSDDVQDQLTLEVINEINSVDIVPTLVLPNPEEKFADTNVSCSI
jgi:hypothetical protein